MNFVKILIFIITNLEYFDKNLKFVDIPEDVNQQIENIIEGFQFRFYYHFIKNRLFK